MSLAPGARLGIYEIVCRIGAGGMGEVYRARDTTLDRDVALKLLPAEFSNHPDRLARFEREAKTLASLNHSNVAQIYGFERGDGDVRAIVMEFVEGEDLAERLQRGALPIDDALKATRQVADVLDVAHAAGIIHRDLKPGNVRIRPDGVVKVLDFGLAKLARDQNPDHSAAYASTMTSPAMTGVGVILGTAAYMAPEQAKGLAVDKRADVWALGCLLFEMLTGRRLFAAENVSETIAAVLTREPQWAQLPDQTPESIRRLLRRCIVREPRQRLSDIGVARLEIDDAVTGTNTTAEPPKSKRIWPMAIGAGVVGIAIGAAAALNWPRAKVPERVLTAGSTIASPQLSPDGHELVYVRDERIVVRSLDTGDETVVTDSHGAMNPFWSTDSTRIAYFRKGAQGEELRFWQVAGGPSRSVIKGAQGAKGRFWPVALYGGTWCEKGIVFLDRSAGQRTMRMVNDTGEEIAKFDNPEGFLFAYPHCLSGGRILAIAVEKARPQTAKVVVVTPKEQVILETLSVTSPVDVRWPVLAGSNVVFERTDPTQGLWKFPVDAHVTRATERSTLALVDATRPSIGGGKLTALTGLRAVGSSLVWVNRSGRLLGSFGKPQREFRSPSLSPDATRVIAEGRLDTMRKIWIHTVDSAEPWADAGVGPAWSPDGKRVAFVDGGLLVRPTEGGEPDRLTSGARPSWINNEALVFQRSQDGDSGVWFVLAAKGAKPARLVEAASEPSVSIDGKWIAYVQERTGVNEVFVAPLAHPEKSIRVSTDGGRFPRWAANGLFFACGPPVDDTPGANRALCTAPVDPISGKILDVEELFDGSRLGFRVIIYGDRGYDVPKDGRRILVQTNGREGTPSITLIENVKTWLKGRR